jgi:hypothetical protein
MLLLSFLIKTLMRDMKCNKVRIGGIALREGIVVRSSCVRNTESKNDDDTMDLWLHVVKDGRWGTPQPPTRLG